ncbi:hypothetical protein HDU97_005096 [Phlyctochytrium planicorne]|nr:hypothetical protein HDU97_005096 [Phlyctochytrium planicorne]
MSIFNQITFFVLVAEISIYLITLIPLNFIPVHARKAFMQSSGKLLANDTVVWLARIVLLLVGGVFVDTVIRLRKLDSQLHERHDHQHSSIETTIEDLQYKTKLFYSQRNMYLSLTSLFLVIVLYRRIKDIYLTLQLQEEKAGNQSLIKNLKAQLETMMKLQMKEGEVSSSAKETKDTKETKPEAEKVTNLVDLKKEDTDSGLRKRK